MGSTPTVPIAFFLHIRAFAIARPLPTVPPEAAIDRSGDAATGANTGAHPVASIAAGARGPSPRARALKQPRRLALADTHPADQMNIALRDLREWLRRR